MPSPLKGQSYLKNIPKYKLYPNNLLKTLNSSQFGTKFRGGFLTKGKFRYTYNRYYNKGINFINNWYNKSSVKTLGLSLFPFLDE